MNSFITKAYDLYSHSILMICVSECKVNIEMLFELIVARFLVKINKLKIIIYITI
jgi:hypothetical protein